MATDISARDVALVRNSTNDEMVVTPHPLRCATRAPTSCMATGSAGHATCLVTFACRDD